MKYFRIGIAIESRMEIQQLNVDSLEINMDYGLLLPLIQYKNDNNHENTYTVITWTWKQIDKAKDFRLTAFHD